MIIIFLLCIMSTESCRFLKVERDIAMNRSVANRRRFLTGLLLAASLLACHKPLAFRPHAYHFPSPLAHAHAHNDYAHPRPLFDALAHGFTSIEADVHLVDGELYVAHDKEDIQPDRTLEALYLDPLQEIVRRQGAVYPGGQPLLLFIDIKSDADSTYRVLRRVLEKKYKPMLTKFTPKGMEKGPILVVLSGNRPFELLANERVRYAACDGRLADLSKNVPALFFPVISDKWSDHFSWMGKGEMPTPERRKLDSLIVLAHAGRHKLRFWATDHDSLAFRINLWQQLLEAGVDLINTDDLEGFRRFYLERYKR